MYQDNIFDLARERSYPTPYQNSTVLPLLLMSLAIQKHTPDTKKSFNREYDYIVVGAGAAGSVVAARLSEDPSKTVLLLEAGKAPPLITEMPSMYPFFEGTDLYWNYRTEPQEYAGFAHVNRRIPVPSGKTLGGSSTISALFYIRGNRADYNGWAEMGARGWDWRSVFPYFLRAEDNTDPDIAHNGFHACGGPMTVGRFPSTSELKPALEYAAACEGYPYGDVNGKRQKGFNDLQANVRKGQTVSTAKAYLVPSEDRPNLDIITEAYVTKVLIEDGRALGVQFDIKGSRCEVRANSEVILSAGALKTPQILMLSGIGPRRTLEELDIPVMADLPVGDNFQDHVGAIVNFYSTNDRPTLLEKLQDPINIWQYKMHRKGPLGVWMDMFGSAYVTDNTTAQKLDLPECHLSFAEGIWGNRPTSGLSQEVYDQLYGPYLNKSTVFCLCENHVTQSTGYVSIRSGNPFAPPVIDPKYYNDPRDLIPIVAGMKTCYEIMESPVMKQFGYRPFQTLMPGCEDALDFDEYLECYARSFIFPTAHPVGTARMGDIRDDTTVVDPELRVKGIQGLRVVDASVMPKIPRGNTNTPVVMIAEKASDIIKRSY